MARMVLDQPAGLPAGHLADQLNKSYPLVRWQVGDGPLEGIQPLERPASIMGRGEEGLILLGIERIAGQLESSDGAPPHRYHVKLTGPSTDDLEMRQRVLLMVAGALSGQGGGALQLERGGPWVPAEVLARGTDALAQEPAPGFFSAVRFFQAEGGNIAPTPSASPPPPAVPTDDPSAHPFPRGSGDRPLFGRKTS